MNTAMKPDTNPVLNLLPEMCYSLLCTEKKVIIIKLGETGYYTTKWPAGSTQEMVDDLNAKLGVTKAQVMAMEMGSMFGWDIPGANPELYEKAVLNN